MLKQFQKGDRVEYIESGDEGTVVKVEGEEIQVLFDDDEVDSCLANELTSLEVAHRNSMNKLTILAKKIVDADLRNMIKVGWLDNSLQLTQEGEDAVLADYLAENKVRFGKMAEEELKERRKDRKE